MTTTALPLQSQISQTSEGTTTYKLIEVQYGNGYSQRAGDGYNSTQASWTVNWENITATDYSTLTVAFDTAGGSAPFAWTAPGDSFEKKWIVKSLTKSILAGSVYTVKATLEQVFDL